MFVDCVSMWILAICVLIVRNVYGLPGKEFERECNECIIVRSLSSPSSSQYKIDTSKWLGEYCFIGNKIGKIDNNQKYPVYSLTNGKNGAKAEITVSPYKTSQLEFFIYFYNNENDIRPIKQFLYPGSRAQLINEEYVLIEKNKNPFDGNINKWSVNSGSSIYMEAELNDKCYETGFDVKKTNLPRIRDVKVSEDENGNLPDMSNVYGLHGIDRNKGDISGVQLYAPKHSMMHSAECNECIEVTLLNSQRWSEDTSKWLGLYCFSGNDEKTNYPIYELTNGNFAKITIGPYFTTNLEFFIYFYDNNRIQLKQFLYIGSNAKQIFDENNENKYILINNDNNPFDGNEEYNWITNGYPGSISIIAKLDENNCKNKGFDIESDPEDSYPRDWSTSIGRFD